MSTRIMAILISVWAAVGCPLTCDLFTALDSSRGCCHDESAPSSSPAPQAPCFCSDDGVLPTGASRIAIRADSIPFAPMFACGDMLSSPIQVALAPHKPCAVANSPCVHAPPPLLI